MIVVVSSPASQHSAHLHFGSANVAARWSFNWRFHHQYGKNSTENAKFDNKPWIKEGRMQALSSIFNKLVQEKQQCEIHISGTQEDDFRTIQLVVLLFDILLKVNPGNKLDKATIRQSIARLELFWPRHVLGVFCIPRAFCNALTTHFNAS
eukprot:TRINITY_DN140723_c0_g1_i1.p2 TRINITY_DN140723_c0_g1~~TRINITY_DN140723_c0_g1_i1.p2  ORF type:complete len:151 (-),score=9.64 TRINITY_DN140723_c0_g1_i1:64-516(-)